MYLERQVLVCAAIGTPPYDCLRVRSFRQAVECFVLVYFLLIRIDIASEIGLLGALCHLQVFPLDFFFMAFIVERSH